MAEGPGPGSSLFGDTPFAAVIDAARKGDETALEYLMAECRNYLLLIANEDMDRSVQARFGASDFVQQTMLAACQNLAGFRGDTPQEFKAWLRTILQRDLIRVRRQFHGTVAREIGRERSLDDSACEVPSPADSARTPGSDAVLREQATLLHQAMNQLPENYRTVIELRDWQDFSFPRIGETLGISEEAARKLWKRAMLKLEEALRPVLGEHWCDATPLTEPGDGPRG